MDGDEESEDEMIEYKDDLDFLNRLKPKQIANLSSMFRNEGRGFVKDARLCKEKNKTTVAAVGGYQPNHASVQVNSTAKLTSFVKQPRPEAVER